MNDLVPMNDLQTMASAIAKSGLFGAKTPEQALALMLVAQAEGLHPASAARDYDIIQGKGAKKSEAMLRDFLKSGGAVKWHKLDDGAADATFSHPAGGEVRIAWDMKRAETAGLKSKDMYKKFPRQMLRARCVSEGVRTVCPMATGGMYTPEEVQDIPEKDMGAAVVVDQPRAKSKPTGDLPINRQDADDASRGAGSPATESSAAQAQDATPVAPDAPPSSAPAAAAGPGKSMLPAQMRIVRAKLTNSGLTEIDLIAKFGKIEDLKFDDFAKIQAWLQERAA